MTARGQRIRSALLLAAFVGLASPLRSAPVVNINGVLVRIGAEMQGVPTVSPCNYGDHERVLAPIVDLVRQKAPGHAIWRNPFGGKSVRNQPIACGESAQAMRNHVRASGLLPPGWGVWTVDSADLFWAANPGFGTSHTVYLVEAPDGTAYLMDSYFQGVEMTRMKRTDVPGLYEPDVSLGQARSEMVGNKWVSGWGNPTLRWVVKGDDYENFQTVEETRRLMLRKAGEAATGFLSSYDPNDIAGPGGAGDQRWIDGRSALGYTISFENLATASLPAVDVRVDCYLDPLTMDLRSLNLGAIRFGDRTVAVPGGLDEYETSVDLRPEQDLLVRITATLDVEAAILRWTFHALDPDTLAAPEDIATGFLPPNATSPEGEGYLSFDVLPLAGLATGEEIAVRADIWFDSNEPISTPVWRNTVDVTRPASTLLGPSGFTPRSTLGLDCIAEDGHSGVVQRNVWASWGGDFLLVAAGDATGDVTATLARERTYSLYCVAEDAVGNREASPSQAQVTVTIGPLGDVSGDLDASVRDVVLVVRELVAGPTGIDCDVNEDGAVDALDTRLAIDTALGRPQG